MILRFENIERKRVAAFLDRVNDFLELSKHRLPEKCAAQIVDLSIDDIGAHLRIARLLEQMIRKQLFVEGRGNLRQENRVLVILKQLGFLREPGMHRVTSFVRQRVNIGEDILLVVHQDVGRRAVASG